MFWGVAVLCVVLKITECSFLHANAFFYLLWRNEPSLSFFFLYVCVFVSGFLDVVVYLCCICVLRCVENFCFFFSLEKKTLSFCSSLSCSSFFFFDLNELEAFKPPSVTGRQLGSADVFLVTQLAQICTADDRCASKERESWSGRQRRHSVSTRRSTHTVVRSNLRVRLFVASQWNPLTCSACLRNLHFN